jgi:predicted MPP superfamily phosphohydrolase
MRRRWIAAIATAVVLTLLFFGGSTALVAYAAERAQEIRVTQDRLVSADLPDEFDGARVVFLADIHTGPFLSKSETEALVEKVNALEPDVVLMGGDYVGGRVDAAADFYAAAASLEAPLGVYAVLGNHDVWEGADEARAGLEAAGIHLLENDRTTVTRDGASIVIAGVEDLYTGDPDVETTGADIEPEDFAVLISHNPDVFPDGIGAMPDTWDLALAGHTHGGQITFGGTRPVVGSKYGSRFSGGWTAQADTPVLVTRGVGTVTVPVRIGAPAEVHVITLASDDTAAGSRVVGR